MEMPIPNKFKKLWDVWDIRCCILFSLFLQAFLVFFASFRQRSKRTFLIFFIWSAYVLADWVAAVAIGIIIRSQGNDCDPHSWRNGHLFAFWASFLLLHLGGPDNITSFSLEDNEFWFRHLFGLIFQVLTAAYSIYLTLPSNKLWLPTVLVFIVGTIKYAERTYALYCASLDRFGSIVLPKPDPGPDYEEYPMLLSTQSTEKDLIYTTRIDPGEVVAKIGKDVKELADIKLLQLSHVLFQCFKGLIVGFFVSYRDRETCRRLFLDIDHKCAFKLIEYELSFMYHILHTKAVVARGRVGYIFRFISFSFILVATSVFISLVNGKKVMLSNKYLETAITYFLLIGAIILDVISIIKLILSDWTLISPNCCIKWKEHIAKIVLKRRRWAETVSQYNMISYCLDEQKIRPVYELSSYVNSTEIIDTMKIMWYSSLEKVPSSLHKLIFNELNRKSKEHGENLKEAIEACLQRGDSALQQSSNRSYIQLRWSISEFQYEESILLWHLATEVICSGELETSSAKIACKLVSRYMFYLLLMQPTMMSTVLGSRYKVFQDTCAQFKRFNDKHKIRNHLQACTQMISIQ